MENDTSVITTDTALLVRINEYQKKIAGLSINLTHSNTDTDNSVIYDYQMAFSNLSSWKNDIYERLNPDEKKESNKIYEISDHFIRIPVFKKIVSHSFAGSKSKNNIDEENLKEIRDSLRIFEQTLKKFTDKYFSDKKPERMLVR